MTTSSTLPDPDPDPRRAQPIALPPPHAAHCTPVPATPSAEVVAEFTTFYKAALPRLMAFLRWQGASLAEAADCAQESLEACFQQWPSIEWPYTWCRTTASRRYGRHLATIREHPVEDLTTVGSPLLLPDTDIDALEHRHTVLAILDRLPLRQRQVLAWTYDGATTAEIARALHISPDAVRAHRHHARTTLRAHRGELGVDR